MASCLPPPLQLLKAFHILRKNNQRLGFTGWCSGWKLLKANGRRNGRHFTAFDSELKFLKLYKYRHFRQGWLPNAASVSWWAHHLPLLKRFTALKSLGIFRNASIGVDKNEGPEAAFLHRSERARARRLIPIDPQQNYKAKTG
jgi:hypothetical protein